MDIEDAVNIYGQWARPFIQSGAFLAALPHQMPGFDSERDWLAAVDHTPSRWTANVNNHVLPMPTLYANNGTTAYWLAPDDVQAAVRVIRESGSTPVSPSDAAAKNAQQQVAKRMLAKMGLPDPPTIARDLKWIGLAVAAGFGVMLYNKLRQRDT